LTDNNFDTQTNIITKIKFLTQHLETLSMLKENPNKWKDIEKQNKEQADYNYELFTNRMQEIRTASSTNLDTWLKNYTDFSLIFNVDFDK